MDAKIRRLKSSPVGIAAERPPARTRARLRRQATSQRLARSDFNRGYFRRSIEQCQQFEKK